MDPASWSTTTSYCNSPASTETSSVLNNNTDLQPLSLNTVISFYNIEESSPPLEEAPSLQYAKHKEDDSNKQVFHQMMENDPKEIKTRQANLQRLKENLNELKLI